jgi:GNAT superfamily N-acetyltransferase
VADVSVRPARLGDVEPMADIQLAGMRATPGMPAAVDLLPDRDAVTRAWERAVMVPPSSRHRVWVATEEETVVGLAAVAPGSDPDLDPATTGELLLLTVAADHRGHGHGSRLLAAAMDALVQDQQSTAVAWLVAQDEAGRQFLEQAGWGVDGAHRSLAPTADDGVDRRLRQVRMGTDLTSVEQLDTN